ncbi:protein phosphatase 2C domain-containing protein, partial [Caldilinea sp.]|uniref:PP2C family protein-serine/threonine phosphatase n=1 Tax=Caldilinea sp. TaxID=2293560 RepID=UPI002BE0B75B|nr:protein phosphatase 2C domain-containing protein [Caldilinea sp.]
MKPESREYGVSGRAEFCSTLAHQPVHLLAPKAMNRKQSPWILGARSETGFVRSSNEDRMGWIRTAYGDAFVVSDGMGGYRGGALAAEITVRSLQEHLALITPQSAHFADGIRQAFLNANREVFSQRDPEDPETRDMGATGVALVTSGSRAMIAHVGDSRAYLWRPDTGLRLLTNDHTRVQSMLEAGLLTPAQAAVHPDASVLDRAIGHQPTVQVDVSDWIDLKNGDMLLLCSDGLSGYVSDSEIESILRTDGGVQNTTDRLIECALSKGGADNVTVQLVRFVPRQDISFARLAKSPIVLVPVCIGLSTIALLLMYTQLTKSEQHKTAVLQKQLEQSRLEVASLNKDLAARKAPTPP